MAKTVTFFVILTGVLLIGLAPESLGQGRGRDRQSRSRVYYDHRRDNDYYYGERRNPQDTAGKALARTGIGAGIGAGAGALLGGGKGALIGATAGAVGGLIYHETKVSRQRNRRRGW